CLCLTFSPNNTRIVAERRGAIPSPLGRDDPVFTKDFSQLKTINQANALIKSQIMKLNKIAFLLTLALVATLAATGCKKTTPRTTMLPGTQPIIGDTGSGPTITPGTTFDPGSGPGTGPGTGPIGPISTDISNWDPSQCDKDYTALADQTVH